VNWTLLGRILQAKNAWPWNGLNAWTGCRNPVNQSWFSRPTAIKPTHGSEMAVGTTNTKRGSWPKSATGCLYPQTRFKPSKMNQIILSITAFVLYLLWFVITIALIITIVGLFVLDIMEDYGWFDIPNQIIDKTINP
jgi:hypothetical protein